VEDGCRENNKGGLGIESDLEEELGRIWTPCSASRVYCEKEMRSLSEGSTMAVKEIGFSDSIYRIDLSAVRDGRDTSLKEARCLSKPVTFAFLTDCLPDLLPHWPLRLLSPLLSQNGRKIQLSFTAVNIDLRQSSEPRLFDNLKSEEHNNNNRRGQVSLEETLNLLTRRHAPVPNRPCA
jgi:hypothetical protein